MVQFNLLPKVKLDYVKTNRTKRMVTAISVLAAASALGIMILLFMVVQVFQRQHSNHLSEDIKTEAAKLQSIPDLDKILTVQNQLNNLTALHDGKPVTSRLTTYIQQFTPKKINIKNITVDLDASTIKITGTSNSVSNINKFVDTLKFTSYVVGDTSKPAFSSVVLTSFKLPTGDDKGVDFEINFAYDPAIFSNANDVILEIPPGKITTRSQTEKPEEIFQPAEPSTGEGN